MTETSSRSGATGPPNSGAVKRLQEFAAKSPDGEKVLKYFAQFSKADAASREEITIDQMVRSGIGLVKAEIIAVLKALTLMEMGIFLNGRHGKPSRFVFNRYDIRTLGLAGIGKSDMLDERSELDKEPSPVEQHVEAPRRETTAVVPSQSPKVPKDVVNYQFPLRTGLLSQISLPIDITPEEAERISAFIKSLPIRTSSAVN